MSHRRAALAAAVVLVASLASACESAGPIFEIGADVPTEDRRLIQETVRWVETWLEDAGYNNGTIRVIADPAIETLMAWYFGTISGETEELADVQEFLEAGGALAVGSDVYLHIGSSWHSVSAQDRQFLVAHEAFHAAAFKIAHPSPFTSDYYRTPRWLEEGAADWVAAAVLDANGILEMDTWLSRTRADARGSRDPLKDLEADTYSGPNALGALAVDMLVGDRGTRALLAIWADGGDGVDWGTAFRNASGQSVDAFYGRFEERRAAEFQPHAGGVAGVVLDADGGGFWGAGVAVCRAAEGDPLHVRLWPPDRERCALTWTGRDGAYAVALEPDDYVVVVSTIANELQAVSSLTSQGWSDSIAEPTVVPVSTAVVSLPDMRVPAP